MFEKSLRFLGGRLLVDKKQFSSFAEKNITFTKTFFALSLKLGKFSFLAFFAKVWAVQNVGSVKNDLWRYTRCNIAQAKKRRKILRRPFSGKYIWGGKERKKDKKADEDEDEGAKVKSGREPKRKKKLGVGSVGEDAPLCVLCGMPRKEKSRESLVVSRIYIRKKNKKILDPKGGKRACVKE